MAGRHDMRIRNLVSPHHSVVCYRFADPRSARAEIVEIDRTPGPTPKVEQRQYLAE